jgi:hypothetical protein
MIGRNYSKRDSRTVPMRDYGKVRPAFWTGDTGRELRAAGRDAQLVALYLMTGPSANMIGLYHLPMPLLCHHTGLTREGASKALRRVCETGFCLFEGSTETIFVPQMARIQIGETLKVKDNRHKAVLKELRNWRKSPFLRDFYRLYGTDYNLPDDLPFEAPSKPLRSQEQEQEQEQEKEQEPSRREKKRFKPPTVAEVAAYCQERGNGIDAEEFVAHYEGNGWVQGKNRAPVKSWKACIVTWEKNRTKQAGVLASRVPTAEDLANWNPVDGGLGVAQ